MLIWTVTQFTGSIIEHVSDLPIDLSAKKSNDSSTNCGLWSCSSTDEWILQEIHCMKERCHIQMCGPFMQILREEFSEHQSRQENLKIKPMLCKTNETYTVKYSNMKKKSGVDRYNSHLHRSKGYSLCPKQIVIKSPHLAPLLWVWFTEDMSQRQRQWANLFTRV